MTTIILVRHAESDANGSGFFAGQLDIPLSDRGREQARRTANYMAKTYQVDKIYSSDLSRAYDTAKPIAEMFGLEIEKEKCSERLILANGKDLRLMSCSGIILIHMAFG